MTLNLTPEVIVDFIVAISGFVLTITTYIKPKTKKITSLVIGITYIIKENFYSPGFVIVIGLSVLLIYLGFQPNAVDIQIQGGYIRLPWTGLFNDIGMILTAISEVYMLYWAIKTLKNAPFLIKKEAYLFFLGIFFASVVAMFFYVLYLIDPFYIHNFFTHQLYGINKSSEDIFTYF